MLIFKSLASRVIGCHQMSKAGGKEEAKRKRERGAKPNYAEQKELKSLAFLWKLIFPAADRLRKLDYHCVIYRKSGKRRGAFIQRHASRRSQLVPIISRQIKNVVGAFFSNEFSPTLVAKKILLKNRRLERGDKTFLIFLYYRE